MKKILAIFGAAIAISAISCSKVQTVEPVPVANEPIKLNITFPDQLAKGVKTAWTAGDKLNIWFYNNDSVNHASPDLVITYDGTEWTAGELRTGAALAASGDNMTLLYEGYNDLSSYTYDWYNEGAWFHQYSYNSGSYYSNPLIFYAQQQAYSFSANTLSATITSWRYYTMIKFLVKNDNGNMTNAADKYGLQVHNTTSPYDADNVEYPDAKGAIVVKKQYGGVQINNGSSNYYGWSGGVQEADGIAFYYIWWAAKNADITFTLEEDGAADKTYSVTNKTISGIDEDHYISIPINYSSFN